ncbi:MAG: ankyrin, partial [uncultured bacterium]
INKSIDVNEGSNEIAAIEKTAATVNKLPADGDLFGAARANDTSEIAALLKSGINVDATNENGMSPLMCAVESESVEVVDLLLDKSDIEALNNNGINALGVAVNKNNIKMVKRLIEKGGAAVNCLIYKDNQTPLMLAVRKNQLEMAEYLLNKGASLRAATTNGWTPLAFAVHKKDLETINLLLDKKWDPPSEVNIVIGEYTLLMMAFSYDCDTRIINALLSAGADIKTSMKMAKDKKNDKLYNLLKNFKRR